MENPSPASTPILTWDRPVGKRRARSPIAQPEAPAAGSPTVEQAIGAWIAVRGFAPTTALRARDYLESTRARGWRVQRGIVTIEHLTAAEAAAYLLYLRDRGAAPATLRKAKTLFCSLQAFCAETPGYRGLEGDELRALKLPPLVERIPPVLTEDQCLRLIAACGSSLRDRLIVETLLLAGLRVSELCALTLDAVHLESRPAFVHVCGQRAQSPSPQDASGAARHHRLRRERFRPRLCRPSHYIQSVRPKTYHREVFLSCRQEQDGGHSPLTYVGVQRLMARLETACGIHCNPHKLRHTFATRCVDKGVPMFHLQDALGHRSLDMVRRYYSQNRHAQAESFYRAFGARYGP